MKVRRPWAQWELQLLREEYSRSLTRAINDRAKEAESDE